MIQSDFRILRLIALETSRGNILTLYTAYSSGLTTWRLLECTLWRLIRDSGVAGAYLVRDLKKMLRESTASELLLE
jgi:hypothetical protein